jgi:hypothetical protein
VWQEATTYATFELEAAEFRKRFCANGRAAQAKERNKNRKSGAAAAAGGVGFETDDEQGAEGEACGKGVRFVLKSFAGRHRDLLNLLAAHSQPSSSSSNGLTMSELLKACQKKLVVSTQAELDKLLVELKDHHLVGSSKDRGDKGPERLAASAAVCAELNR